MKITLKDKSTLINDAKGSLDQIDDRLENFFKTYGGQTIEPTDFKVYQYINSNGDVKNKFSFDFFPKNMLYTNITIPEEWTTSIELEENSDIIFCKNCGYKVKPSQLYPFRDGKVVTRDTNDTSDVTDDTESNVFSKTYSYFLDNNLDVLCPICFDKNTFAKLS